MSRSQPPRSPFRVAAYAIGAAIAVVVLLAAVLDFGISKVNTAGNTESGLRQSSTTRDQFEQLYELGWRADGAAGNTAVTAVYYFPKLREALSDYGERSFVQAQTLKTLETEDDALLLPLLIELEGNEPLATDFELPKHAVLFADASNQYSIARWETLQDVQAPNKLIGVLWARKANDLSAPRQLTLTMTDVPGNVQPTTFTWNAAALELGSEGG